MSGRPLLRFHRTSPACGESERGSASVEAIVAIPVVLLIIFGIIQGVVVLQANNLAQVAASSAYETARLYDATTEDGIAQGNATLSQAGTTLSGTEVTVQRTAETVTVTVTGTAPSLLPGVPIPISRTIIGPTEKWVG